MQHLAGATCGLFLALCATAQAQTAPSVLVELYTSQGCSSCPPADDYLAAFSADPHVIVLALHVDYWDYIGWEDRFANPKFTQRQKAYARAINSRTIYTPQIVVGGIDRVEGFDPETFSVFLAKHMAVMPEVALSLDRDARGLTIRATTAKPFPTPAVVQLVRYTPQETVEIKRGENAGRTITYHNIVTSWETLGEWTGEAPLALAAPLTGNSPAVVIVQEAGPYRVLAAAQVK